MSLFDDFGLNDDVPRHAAPRVPGHGNDFDSSSSSSSSSDDDEDDLDENRNGGILLALQNMGSPDAEPMEDSASESDDDDDDDDDDGEQEALDMPMSYTGIMGHSARPFRGVPDSWTVYEAFSMVIPQRLLMASKRQGFPMATEEQEATWGRFIEGDAQAEAAKRLLFLMLAAVSGATASETGDPEHLPPPGATAKTKRGIELKAKAANDANPNGVVKKRPNGVAGATIESTPFLGRMYREMLSPPVSGANKQPVWALPSKTRGVFILRTAKADAPQLLARRVSVLIEELMSPCARSVGWRWWFLVHDPRISLPQWVTRIVEDNQACRKMRMDKIRKSKEGAVNSRSRGDPRLGGAIDSPECYQSIYDVRSYAKVVREYWEAMGCPANAAPRADNHALARGIAAAATSLHPARVFSPQVATEIDWVCQNVCGAQRTIHHYINPDTSLLGGAFPRPSRTIAYDPSAMTPEGVNEMPLPRGHPERAKMIDDLLWEQLEYWCSQGHVIDSTGARQERLPDYLISAVQTKNMAETTRILDSIRASPDPSFDPKRFMKLVRNSVTEDLLEGKEGAAYAMEAEERHTAKRRRLSAEDDPFGVDLAAEAGEVVDVQMLDPDDTDSQHTEAFAASETDEAIRGVPEATMSHDRMFALLKTVEEHGSRLNLDLVRRCPLLYLRMVHNAERMQIRETYEMGTPEYRVAMDNFRSQAMTTFVATLTSNLDNEEALSKPVRYGTRFLLGLNQRPNYIRRHGEWLYAKRMARRSQGDGSSPEAAKRFFLNTMQQAGGEDADAGERRAPAAADPVDAPPPTRGLWHEWPAFGAMDLGDYANYRLMFGKRLSHYFRCKPGEESTNLLYRLAMMQGTAWWYHWGMHGDQLLWGPGGVGKSYLFDCLRAQAFNGQIESADNLTQKWCAVGAQYPLGDVLMIIEEAQPRVVGQDEMGNPHPGDELIKTLLTSHFIETIEPNIDKETKRRTVGKSQAMWMVTFFVATNLVIKNLANGEVSPAIRRFMKSHVTLPSKGGISLSKINNPLSTENQTREQTEFFSQLKVMNAICMLVEKMIEAMVLDDVNMDVWTIHSSWFFDEVARVCQVPPASMSNREHLAAACRQVAIRYAVHRLLFSETAAKGVRCRSKSGEDSSNPEDWVPARFEFHTLLQLQGYLVVTEEMVIDVLTSMRTTYIPTTSWRVIRCMKTIVQKIRPSHRRVTQSTLWLQHNEDRGDEEEEAALEGLSSSDSESDSDSDSDSDVGDGGGGTTNDAVLIRNKGRKEKKSDGQRVCSDKNYCAFQYPTLPAALDYFTSQTTGGLDRDVFYQVLVRQLSHELISHTDRNRPKREEDPDTGQMRLVLDPDTGKPIYDKVIKSPIVIVEKAPIEDAGGHGDYHGNHRSSAYGGSPPVQVCILIEYLEQERQDSLNDIIKRGFSYRGQRRRKVLTGCGTQERIPVRESGGPDREETAVAIDYMGTVVLEPNPDNPLVRINHFPKTVITDSFVDNESLAPERDGSDLTERLSLEIDGYLDKIIIDHHLNYCGLPVNEDYYPWVHTQKLRDIVMSKKDPIGIPVSARWKNRYPEDFRGIYRRRRAPAPTQEEQDGSTTTTTTTQSESTCAFSEYLRQSRRKRRREDF